MPGAPARIWYLPLAVTPFLVGRLFDEGLLYPAAQLAFLLGYLAWCHRRAPGSLRFALQLAGQAASQLLLLVGLLVAVAVAADRSPLSQQDLAQGLVAFLQIIPQWAVTIAWWRALQLVRSDLPLAPAVSGRWSLAARPDQARQLLVLRLDRLRAADAPRLPRLLYAAPLRASLMAEDVGSMVYRVWWNALPLMARVELTAQGSGSELTIGFGLRGGVHRLEWFAHPGSVAPLARFLRTHLAEPLREQAALESALQRQEQLRQQAVEARLRVLQAQIEPHFFFNSLANLRHLYRMNVQAGEDMLNHLIGYLRGAMQDLRAHDSTVEHELDLAAHYLAIMQIRFGGRLSFWFSTQEEARRLAFPPAMLISLVENALKHGLRDHPAGELRIAAHLNDQHLRVCVTDNGPGWSSVGGTGAGLSNIRQRLEVMHGAAAALEVGMPVSGGFEACIVIPIKTIPS